MHKILELRAAGKSYAEISAELGVAKSTVSYHVSANGKLLAASRRRKRKRNIKQEAVAYKGGKCCICSYDKCAAALEFHHLDPESKDIGVYSGMNGGGHSFETLKKELDKCALVCSNCHREIHAGVAAVPGTNL